ncbi:MAG: nucleotidyltransferase family protein [Thermomicrobiales bacterium]
MSKTTSVLAERIEQKRDEIRAIVEANRASNPRVFGSVLHGTDDEQSDIDLLIDADPDASLFDLGAIQYDLSELLGTRVDVLTPGDLPVRFRDRVIAESRSI